MDERGVAEMRERVGSTLRAAEHDERFAHALNALAEAGHNFNKWEPGAAALDALCDAAEVYAEERKRLAVRIREE